jgi:hypothetical protein
MIKCTCCNEEKDECEFSPQITNPGKLYRWCNKCRRNSAPKHKFHNFAKGVEIMRQKSRGSMKFDAKEAKEIRILKSFGLTNRQIAEQYDTSGSTICRIVNRQGLYAEI